MDVSDPDQTPAGPARIERPLVPVVRLLLVGCEPVSWRWHQVRITEDVWRFYVTDRPGVHLESERGRLEFHPQRITVIPPGCTFVFHMTPGVLHGFIHAETPSFPVPLLRTVLPDPFHLSDPDLVDRLKQLGRRLVRVQRPGILETLTGQGLAVDLLTRVLDRLSDRGRERLLGVPDGRLAPALALIEARLGEPLAVADLARVLQVGAARCPRLFRQELGQPPLAYLLGRRVARAADLLAGTDLPLPEVATTCGFPNRSYLSRVFTARMGIPPAQYRSIYRGR
jgi:AraC-like DNA-binding protein